MCKPDLSFEQALLDEAIDLFVNGDAESSKLILRDLMNSTAGFEALAEEVHNPRPRACTACCPTKATPP